VCGVFFIINNRKGLIIIVISGFAFLSLVRRFAGIVLTCIPLRFLTLPGVFFTLEHRVVDVGLNQYQHDML
jgi:hypothetical protein